VTPTSIPVGSSRSLDIILLAMTGWIPRPHAAPGLDRPDIGLHEKAAVGMADTAFRADAGDRHSPAETPYEG
jgi:hypothetical protein